MQFIVPIFIAITVYLYNYRELYIIRTRIKILKEVLSMDDKDRWLIGKFDEVFNEIKKLDSRVSKLEARIGVYVAIAVFVSSAIL